MISKIGRNPQKFDSFELYSKLCAQLSLDIDSLDSVDAVVDLVKTSIKENKNNLNLVFGKRSENMFSTVAAALGKCKLIKQEDGGEIFCNDEISLPDYRIILKDDSEFLVEVKNYHQNPFDKPFSFSEKYFESVIKYSELVSCDVKFAIYYSKLNIWVLLPPSSFKKEGNKYLISAEDSMKRSEMILLGDQMISTESPLEIRFVANRSKPAFIDQTTGQANLTIDETLFYCAGKQVTNELDQKILFYFTKSSSWVGSEPELLMDGERPIAIKLIYTPCEVDESQPYHTVGFLSGMASSLFKSVTENDNKVTAIEVNTHPKNFSIIIPEDHNSEELPLWRFNIQPNES